MRTFKLVESEHSLPLCDSVPSPPKQKLQYTHALYENASNACFMGKPCVCKIIKQFPSACKQLITLYNYKYISDQEQHHVIVLFVLSIMKNICVFVF